MTQVSITQTVRRKAPSIPFHTIAEAILPRDYHLSLVLIGDTLGKRLNKQYKQRNYPTNILSFPLEKDSGEIFINVRRVEREAQQYHAPHTSRTISPTKRNVLTRKHLTYLFIHGCLHLAGYTHGDTMSKLEQKYLTQFT